MISETVIVTALAEGREIISVFLCTGSCGVYHVQRGDAVAIRYYAGGLVAVERANGGVAMLPAEHCGFEFGPPRGVA